MKFDPENRAWSIRRVNLWSITPVIIELGTWAMWGLQYKPITYRNMPFQGSSSQNNPDPSTLTRQALTVEHRIAQLRREWTETPPTFPPTPPTFPPTPPTFPPTPPTFPPTPPTFPPTPRRILHAVCYRLDQRVPQTPSKLCGRRLVPRKSCSVT